MKFHPFDRCCRSGTPTPTNLRPPAAHSINVPTNNPHAAHSSLCCASSLSELLPNVREKLKIQSIHPSMSAMSEKSAQAEKRKEKQKASCDDEVGLSERRRSVPADSYYRLKHIHISKKQTIPLLMQNENGPCPLLAICTPLPPLFFLLIFLLILIKFI
jgi:hypothetical protein